MTLFDDSQGDKSPIVRARQKGMKPHNSYAGWLRPRGRLPQCVNSDSGNGAREETEKHKSPELTGITDASPQKRGGKIKYETLVDDSDLHSEEG
jgi:hypothetical protein